ncbi:MAG: hypothetical protein HY290_00070 [Planctomycetia bacterium]|nr:hypothetical protein [Planctomycetia bacterium]
MLQELSKREQETLVKIGANVTAGRFDTVSLNTLVTFCLIRVDDDWQFVLTDAGQQIYRQLLLQRSEKPDSGQASNECQSPA